MDQINFEDFKKLDIKIAEIKEAEDIESSNKLVKLQIDLGDEQRQLVAGISKYYSPEELIGKNIVVITNLKPREIMGVESQGMLLAASDEDGVSLLSPDRDITPGSRVS